MAKIQHYRILLLAAQVQDFKDLDEASTPVQAELGNYLTYLELLALWPEENNPFDHARVLAETKTSNKVQRYLLNTIEKVVNASTDDLLAIVDRYVDEQYKLIVMLKRQVAQLETLDNNRLERIEELLEEIRVKQAEIEAFEEAEQARQAELQVSENTVSDLQGRLNELQGDYADLEGTENNLRTSLEQAERLLVAANEKISTLTTQVDNLQRSL